MRYFTGSLFLEWILSKSGEHCYLAGLRLGQLTSIMLDAIDRAHLPLECKLD